MDQLSALNSNNDPCRPRQQGSISLQVLLVIAVIHVTVVSWKETLSLVASHIQITATSLSKWNGSLSSGLLSVHRFFLLTLKVPYLNYAQKRSRFWPAVGVRRGRCR
jgi:hypothetical protein